MSKPETEKQRKRRIAKTVKAIRAATRRDKLAKHQMFIATLLGRPHPKFKKARLQEGYRDPDKISFEQRKIGPNRYESIPRRRKDYQLFKRFTPRMEDAYILIHEGYRYALSGLPSPRMRYTDAPGGRLGDLTDKQTDILRDYKAWCELVSTEVHYSITEYMTGATLREIDRSLNRITNSTMKNVIEGLNEFCKMKRWGDQIKPRPPAAPDVSGFHAPEQVCFIANEIAITGLPVRDFRIPLTEEVTE